MTADGAGSRGAGDLSVLGGKPLGPQDPAMVGRYRIHALLGIGGMGRVYLGWAQNPGFGASRAGAWVAVKVIRPDLADNPEFRRRFARELETVGRVRTPYAAALVQGEPDAPQPWMVTEFVPGVALADAVQPGWPLPATSVWRLAHDIGNALIAVHQAGIVHRDVKPSNVILGNGGAKIIDFGVAHASDLSQLTATGMNIGTPSYMAPEQAKSGDISPASDVFSLGVLLYFAATGKLPFGEGGTAEVLFRVVYEEPDVSGLNDVEPGLRDLVLRCMAKDPLHRPNAVGVVAMAQSAASAGAWSPNEAVQWPEALAAQIHERTLAAGRTLPDPSLAHPPTPTPVEPAPTPGPYQAPEPPVLFPPVDSTPTMFTGSTLGGKEPENRKRHGVLIASLSAFAVLALGVTALLMWGPGSSGSANAASDSSSAASGNGNVTGTLEGSAGGGGTASATGSTSASGSASLSATGSATTSSSPTSSPSAGASSGAASQQPTSATSTSAPASATTSTSAAGTANKYSATGVCGSGFSVIDHHGITGATIYLLYNSSTEYNCVVTLATTVYGSVSMNATLAVEGGGSGSNAGSFTYYAGPVKEHAPSECVKWGGSYKSSSWTSAWSHCG